jgi:hypothetical protein
MQYSKEMVYVKGFTKYYLLSLSILCFFIIAGCSSGGSAGSVNSTESKTSPKVTYTVNANGATNVFINTKNGAFFTTEMDPATINNSTFILKQGTTPVPGEVTYNGLGAIFTQLNNLAPHTTYTATITSQAKDLSGNPLGNDYVWSWTTGAGSDTNPPKVIHTTNPDGATNVFLNTKIIATFNKVMDPSTITAANFTFMKGTTPVPGKVTYLGFSLIFTPTDLLEADSQYTATIKTGVKDVAGNALPGDYAWSWTTGSSLNMATPVIQYTIPLNSRSSAKSVSGVTPVISNGVLVVSAIFNEPMDPLTITTSTFLLQQGTTPVTGIVIYNPQSLTASFLPAVDLSPNTTYTATITTGVRNIAGTPLASNMVWSFITSPTVGLVPVNLGTAANFAVLAGSTITNTGNTTITGDVGLSPGTAVTGFPPGILNGTFHLADPVAATAKLDLSAAFNDAAGRTGVLTVPTELGGTTLPPGVYNSASGTFGITGPLTLDAQGNANAVFIFKAASTLITASNSTVILINGAQAGNVFWQVGSSATLGTGTAFRGTIMAQASITVTTGATIEGRALTQTAAVTLDTNKVALAPVISPVPLPVPLPVPVPVPVPVQVMTPGTVTGATAADVTPVSTSGGVITVQNNGGHVAATVTGPGAINITNNGAAVTVIETGTATVNVTNNGAATTVTETGTGTVNILNNGRVLTAINTGNGVMTINSTCTGAVTVTNTGNGNITVNATGTAPITLTYSDSANHTYP